jgi:putative DNA primase/helicase
MRRRRSDESVARFRVDRVAAQQELGRKAARWAADSVRALRDADPAVPTELNDRAADNWRPLLAIADRAGGPWPERARRAALELSAVKAGEADTMRTLLLSDIRGVFREKKVDRIKSEALVTALVAMNDRPWPTFDRGRWITPAGIARMLRPYGIGSETIRFGEEPAKGYRLSAFEDAFARYLPSEGVTA